MRRFLRNCWVICGQAVSVGNNAEDQRRPVRWASDWIDWLEAGPRSRSASQTLMIDCRVTPRRPASRSSPSIIHVGKSTFTRLCSCIGRRAPARSSAADTLLPASKSRSKFLAFIQRHLVVTRPADRNNSNGIAARRDDSRPELRVDATDDQPPWLILGSCRDLQKVWVFPQALGLDKVDPMFLQIRRALSRVELKCHIGMENIPLLTCFQGHVRGF